MRRRDALPDPEILRGLRELNAALANEPTADPDLALLVADVEAAKPEPSAAFLASLDARVHAGFPREAAVSRHDGASKPSWRARLRAPQLLASGLAAAVLAGIVAVALVDTHSKPLSQDLGDSSSSSSSSSSQTLSAEGRAPSTAEKSAAEALSAARGSTGASSADSAAPAASTSAGGAAAPKSDPSLTAAAPAAPATATTQQNRKVQRAADLTLTPKPDDVQQTADGVVRETQAAGGYVQRSDIATRDGGGEASFTLRIPSARLDDTLARLSKLAHVGALNQSATDITAATVSAADQLSDARAERAALLRALGKATTDRQIASLRARLADNRSEIAQRKGALDAQRRRADLATVAVTVQGTGKATKNDGGAWTPRDALHDAGRILQVAGGVALIALAVLAPLAILAALALLAGRTLRRRRRESALDGTA
ncbi:DUF4349 domain-containing protein [Baekduia sp.]|jgi:hypothetical protein|uniref:DUF4349 domain-containing protein n=1 Tax=Baekduia sp. TaxID=2600305 RepID=UPI002DFEB404|nr:DUF4349 domain-containing protein [Baekduia sp.]